MEKPLRENQELDGASVAAVLDSLPELVSLWDSDQRCLFANALAARNFGRSPEKLKGVALVDLLGPHSVRLLRSQIMNALDGIGSEQGRTLVDGTGELRHYRATYTPVSVNGSVTGFASVLVDITEELNTQAEVSRESVRVARLIERHRLMIAAGTGVVRRLRQALDELQAADRADAPNVLAHVAQELSGCIVRLREGVTSPPPGDHLDDRVSTSPLPVAEWLPDPDLLTAGSSDSPSQPSADDRLAYLDNELVALLDQLPVAVTEWDRSLSLRYANAAAREFMTRWGVSGATGRRLEEIVDEEFLRAHERFAEDVLRGSVQSFHRHQTGPDGEAEHFHVRYVPRVVHGEVIGAFAYASDVTDRVRAAEELVSARTAYAAEQERQVIDDRIHGAVLQELFVATMHLDRATRASGGDRATEIESTRAYIHEALRGLAQLS